MVDPLTIKITLKKPFSAFINALAHPAAMMISPAALAKYGKEIGFHPVGTGPFEFVEWKPAEYLKVRSSTVTGRRATRRSTLTFRTVTDNNTRAAVVQTGEAQFAFPVPFEQAAVLKKNDKLDVVDHQNSIMTRYLSMSVQQKPFDNPKVREAINYAINKEALAKVAFSGYASVVEGVVPQGVDYAYKTGAWPHDIKKAKALLAEAGYPTASKARCGRPTTTARRSRRPVPAAAAGPGRHQGVGGSAGIRPARAARAAGAEAGGSQGPHVLRRLVLVDRRGRLGPASAADHAGFPARAQQRVVLLEQDG